jgi:hypothetical protein
MGKDSQDNSLLMAVDGEVKEKEVKVRERATKGTANSQGKVFPGICYSGALGEKMEDVLGGCSTLRAGRGWGKAKAVSAGLKGQNVVQGREAHIHQQGREANCGEATPNVAPVEVRILVFDFGGRKGGSKGCVEVSCPHSLEGSDLNLVQGKDLQEGSPKGPEEGGYGLSMRAIPKGW